MNKSWEISGKRVLVFGDMHQKVDWAKAVLEKESGNFDHIVFLGDAFDSFMDPPLVSSITETASFYKDLINGVYGPSTVLLGNHDVAYREASYQMRKGYTIKGLYNSCSGYTNNKAQKINKELTDEDWSKTKLFVMANGWLLSHAGVHPKFWYPLITAEQNVEKLDHYATETLELISFRPSALLEPGQARGGPSRVGGITWLDFGQEFEDGIPYPQIVGHTPSDQIRKIGDSFCIDCFQCSYAIIDTNGKARFEGIEFSKLSNMWLPKKMIFLDYTDFAKDRVGYMTGAKTDKPIRQFTY